MMLERFNSRGSYSLSPLVSIEKLERKQLYSPQMYQTPMKGGYDEVMKEQKVDQQRLKTQEHPPRETYITIEHSPGNNLEGLMSEKTVETTLSTTSSTRNKWHIQLNAHKQKGIKISVEYGNTSTNAKSITLSTKVLHKNMVMAKQSYLHFQFPLQSALPVDILIIVHVCKHKFKYNK